VITGGDTIAEVAGAIALRRVLVGEVRQHGLPRGVESLPLGGVGQRRNGHRLAAVEADERRVDQFADLHHAFERVHVTA
jgi:hypothetical protein